MTKKGENLSFLKHGSSTSDLHEILHFQSFKSSFSRLIDLYFIGSVSFLHSGLQLVLPSLHHFLVNWVHMNLLTQHETSINLKKINSNGIKVSIW